MIVYCTDTFLRADCDMRMYSELAVTRQGEACAEAAPEGAELHPCHTLLRVGTMYTEDGDSALLSPLFLK